MWFFIIRCLQYILLFQVYHFIPTWFPYMSEPGLPWFGLNKLISCTLTRTSGRSSQTTVIQLNIISCFSIYGSSQWVQITTATDKENIIIEPLFIMWCIFINWSTIYCFLSSWGSDFMLGDCARKWLNLVYMQFSFLLIATSQLL